MTQTKKHVLFCIIVFFLPIIVVGAVTYLIDPFQIYRPQQLVTPLFFSDQRFQNAGKINSYLLHEGYDSIIMGHSQSDNFLPSEVAKYMGWKRVLKLTMDGGKPSEESVILDRALAKGKIQHVLWGVGYNYSSNHAEVWNTRRKFPHYFYTDTILDDARYLFSVDSFMKSIHLLRGNLDSSWGSDLETLNYWMTNRLKGYIRFNTRKNIRKLLRERNRALTGSIISELKINKHYLAAESNLIRILKDHPDVNFTIFFPPYFRGADPAKIIAYSQLQKYLVCRCANYSNVIFFGFSDNDRIAANAANFRDTMHYHSGVNLYMLKQMANGKSKLTVENIDGYVQRVRDRVINYNMYSDIKKMIPMAKKEERKKFHKLLHKRRSVKKRKK